MATKDYGAFEQYVISLFNNHETVSAGRKTYTVDRVAKPRPSAGECKTDVFVELSDVETKICTQIKLSVKYAGRNEFLENKMTAGRAEEFFGTGWRDIVADATWSIAGTFESRKLIYTRRDHPTQANSITLGWKLEITHKSRELSARVPLSKQQMIDFIYKGTNQTDDKRNPRINGYRFADAGVADFILESTPDQIKSADDVLRQMIPLDEFDPPELYLVFTANNYRTIADKADGPRSLAVFVDWKCINGKLHANIIYDEPLLYTGERDIKPNLLYALNQLGKLHPTDFNIDEDVYDSRIVY